MPDDSLPTRTAAVLRQTVGSASLFTGALFYFGWVRSRAVADYFGIDVELLDYSTTDYVVRSVSTVFPILVAVAIVVLLVGWAFDRWVGRFDDDLDRIRSFGRRLELPAWLLVAFGVAALLGFELLRAVDEWLPAIGPVATLGGIGLLSVAQRMRTTKRAAGHRLRGYEPIDTRLMFPLGMSGVAAIFIAVFLVADWRGHLTAQNRAADIDGSFPAVVLTSQHELHLFGSERGEVLTDQGSLSEPWTRRYDDLRLWIEANDRWFLIPANWNENKVVHIVMIDETVRLDIDQRGRP